MKIRITGEAGNTPNLYVETIKNGAPEWEFVKYIPMAIVELIDDGYDKAVGIDKVYEIEVKEI